MDLFTGGVAVDLLLAFGSALGSGFGCVAGSDPDSADATSFHSTRILMIQDGTNPPLITEYGTLLTKSTLGQFTADISGSSGAEIRLRITPTTGTVVGKFVRTVMVV